MKSRNVKEVDWINFRIQKLEETLSKEIIEFKYYKRPESRNVEKSFKSLKDSQATIKAIFKYFKLIDDATI
jgi:hypothetical protein